MVATRLAENLRVFITRDIDVWGVEVGHCRLFSGLEAKLTGNFAIYPNCDGVIGFGAVIVIEKHRFYAGKEFVVPFDCLRLMEGQLLVRLNN